MLVDPTRFGLTNTHPIAIFVLLFSLILYFAIVFLRLINDVARSMILSPATSHVYSTNPANHHQDCPTKAPKSELSLERKDQAGAFTNHTQATFDEIVLKPCIPVELCCQGPYSRLLRKCFRLYNHLETLLETCPSLVDINNYRHVVNEGQRYGPSSGLMELMRLVKEKGKTDEFLHMLRNQRERIPILHSSDTSAAGTQDSSCSSSDPEVFVTACEQSFSTNSCSDRFSSGTLSTSTSEDLARAHGPCRRRRKNSMPADASSPKSSSTHHNSRPPHNVMRHSSSPTSSDEENITPATTHQRNRQRSFKVCRKDRANSSQSGLSPETLKKFLMWLKAMSSLEVLLSENVLTPEQYVYIVDFHENPCQQMMALITLVTKSGTYDAMVRALDCCPNG